MTARPLPRPETPPPPRSATMVRQTLALFVDAYRELNARKLFWITLGISLLVVVAFAGIGLNARGFTLFWWTIPHDLLNSRTIEPRLLYKFAFANFAIPIWLAWIATILALVSTASLIPDFVQGGAIELAVSKPISRARLILTKFITGLSFAALQVTVFTVACFIVIGIRGESWEWTIFLAIPIMVLFFSYLYAVCALLGLLTRSTIASLLLTLLFWFIVFGVNAAEVSLLQGREMQALRITQIEARIESLKAQQERQQQAVSQQEESTGGVGGDGEGGGAPANAASLRAAGAALASQTTQLSLERRHKQLDDARLWHTRLTRWQRWAFWGKTLLPKTSETIGLLDRYLLTRSELDKLRRTNQDPAIRYDDEDDIRVSGRAVERRTSEELRSRTLAWVLGTSIAFEGAVLLALIGLFRRRDF
jgi:ABC-type transport system involved in multi-copper enzyme maturation permease subunit